MEVLSTKPKLSNVDNLIKDNELNDSASLKKIEAFIESIKSF